MKGGGAGGGLTIYNILLFYTIFLFFVVYASSLAGVTILETSGNPSNIHVPTNFIDPFQTVGFFIALAQTSSSYTLLFITLIAPFGVMIIYAILQLIRGTG
jgi:hypothetical protein